MSNELNPKTTTNQPVVYQIRIKGQLESIWTDWFVGMTITLEDNGDTILTGRVVDQAALHGLLKKVRDLGMPLVSVCPLEPGRTSQSKTLTDTSELERRFAVDNYSSPISALGNRVAPKLYSSQS